jgi:hypothetical protein
MKMTRIAALTVTGILLVAPAQAVKISDPTVVIPVAIHAPGKGTSQWRTDLWISNHSDVAKDVTVTFYPNGGGSQSFVVPMATFATVHIQDIVLSRFGLSNVKGLLILTTEGNSGFSARARIYNVGNPVGQFGEFVPGLGLSYLNRQAFLPGLSGVDGNRTNVGIANPQDREINPTLDIYDGDHNELAHVDLTVPAHQVLQINDIFATYGIAPQDNVQVEINTNNFSEIDRFYAYGSVAQDQTSDAIFIFGTSPNA